MHIGLLERLVQIIQTLQVPVSYTHLDVYERQVHHRHPMEAIENSIAFLTEDRKKEGLCLGLSVEKNVNLASYPMISRSGIINLKKERQRAEEYRKALAIKTPSIQQLCKNLSGGNQQKVVIAKWLCRCV